MNFPTKDELMAMPLIHLRNLNVENKEQEELVQQVVNERNVNAPPAREVSRQGIPFEITNPAEESKWQAEMNNRMAALKPTVADIVTEAEIIEPEAVVQEPVKKAKRTK